MKFLRTILSIALALLVLVSSTNFVVGMHLCMGEVQDVALFAKAEVCEMEQKLPPCHRPATAPCCEDQAVVHNADDFKASTASPQLADLLPVDNAFPPVLIAEIVPSTEDARAEFNVYHPPLRSCDLNVVHRVFRI